ncbi:MAG TPA: diguanylate cyclase [Bdellovibrionales bacterium]|nr:diguanylate cyclase [Bdellovibrionales bacterium]
MNEEKRDLPKILCVDDESEVLTSLERILKNDFQILPVNSPQLAMDLLDKHRDIAIVLSDNRMPQMSGLDFLKHVQAASPDTVRALLTASVEISDFVRALNTGLVHRLILKPWENDYLHAQMVESLFTHSTLREKRELEKQAITDPVTLLKNHRFFQDHIRIEVERSTRHDRTLSLIMADIDHFKKFNDTYGHPAGDAILKTVAGRILNQVRTLDTVARYGGEEFAIILPDTPFDAAQLVSERIRRAFAMAPLNGPGGIPTNVTLSLGVASTPLHATTASDLITAADQALYRAKRQGRNQSVGAEPIKT